MNSENEDLLEKESAILVDNETSKNLMKLQQLTDLGLEFFDTELEGEDALALNLLNQDAGSLANTPSSSKEQSHVDFSSLNDYVSDSMMASLSPEREQIQIIKVLPVTASDLLVEPSKVLRKNALPNTLFSDKIEGDSINEYQLLSEKSDANVDNSKKTFSKVVFDTFYQKLDDETCKRLKLRSLKIPNAKVRILASANDISNNLYKNVNNKASPTEVRKTSEISKSYVDSSDLENKINDSLLDMLQNKIIGKNTDSGNYFRNVTKIPERANEKECSKFITIFPSKSTSKIINLMVKGKNCRSKQPLNDIELRIVTRILNQDNLLQNEDSSYKNVYYDAESDSNIRYEVKHDIVPEEKDIANDINLIKNKKGRAKGNQGSEDSNQDSRKADEKAYVLKSVARTRCGRVSRPPRHVIRDYKRLKHLTAHGSDAEDENENNGGYADYQALEDANKQAVVNEKEKETENLLYGPLEPNKRQFSSLSLCPTCGKVYLGYRRMAIHFQKYPDHKNEELLKRLLNTKKKPFDDSVLSDSSEINTNESVLLNDSSSVRSNGSLKRKRKLCRKLRVPGTKNPAVGLKELLSVCEVEEIIKYATPIIAGVLNSWEYLLIRSEKLKTNNETLVSVLLKEISVVLKQLRSLSQYLLKPYSENKENISNMFTVEEEDILQHVLGIMPGTYVTIEDEDWAKEFFHFNNCFKNDKCLTDDTPVQMPEPSKASTCNMTESGQKTTDTNSSGGVTNDPIDTFYKLQDRIEFDELDFPHSIEEELGLNSNSALENIVDISTNGHGSGTVIDYDRPLNKSGNLLKNIDNGGKVSSRNYGKGSLHSSLSAEQSTSEPRLLNESSKLSDYVTDFNKPYCPSNALTFDTFVNSDVDMINDFPINLPLLSDNSSDSKDCLQLLRTSSAEDLLNSLKQMDSTNESVMVGLEDAITTNLPLSANGANHLQSTFDETVNQNSSSCMLDFGSISSNFHCNNN